MISTIGAIASSRSGLTVRTAAFIAATGISDATIISALNTMDLSLIANGLGSKFYALYPMVGGTSTTCKYNFMSAIDADSSFRLGFSGGWSFASTGATPNGSTGYADTFLNANTTLSLNDAALHIYNGTDTATNCVDMGVEVGANVTEIYVRYAGTFYTFINNASSLCQVANTDSRGMYTSTRTASNLIKCIKNGAEQSVISNTVVSTAKPNAKIYIGAASVNNTASLFSDRSIRFAGISSGFTAAESATLYTIIQTLQTSLSRNV